MPEYRVLWAIDLDADNERDAAEKAREIQTDLDPANIGHFFAVGEPDPRDEWKIVNGYVLVDMDEEA